MRRVEQDVMHCQDEATLPTLFEVMELWISEVLEVAYYVGVVANIWELDLDIRRIERYV